MNETELINLRGKKEKHFLNEDGTIVAKMYGSAIHYIKNGIYEEIDNSLIKEDNYYHNKSNSFITYFSESTKDILYKLKYNNKIIEFGIKDCNDVNITIENYDSKLSSKVKYINILDGIDFEYDILSDKIKENIILKNNNSLINNIVFFIKTNLNLFLNEKNSIDIVENGNIISTMESPYIIDSDGNIINCVYYKLNKQEENYELEIVIDKDLLDLENIKYPIIIDPTIMNPDNINSVSDTYIYQDDTTVNKGNLEYLKVGVERIDNSDIVNRGLIKFDLPKIGTGSQIIEAELNLTPYTYESENNNFVCIHRVTENWNENSANWNIMNNKYDSMVEGVIDANFMPFCILTNLVKKWYNDKPNYGILLKQNIEEYTGKEPVKFFTKEGNSNYKPYLTITYRNQNGLENYMDYKSQSYSIGNTYINSYNGNLTGIFNIGSTIKGKMPISLKLIYNTNDVVLNTNLGYGKGYRLNLSQLINKETIDNVNYLSYVDEDGTIHYFKKYGTDTVYKDEDGLNMTIEESSIQYILKDKNENKMIFDIINNTGYLKEIIDLSDNKITINYNSNNTISKITDANNNEINLIYETNKITVSSIDEIIQINYENNLLKNIITKSGITNYTCNNNGLITSITDETGLKNSFEYYQESPYRIKKVSEYGIDNSLGNYFNITYNFNSTTVTDNKERVNTMIFNDCGNISSISNLKSSEDIKDAYGKMRNYGKTYITEEGENTKYKNKLLCKDLPNKYVKNYLSNTSFELDTINFTQSDSINQNITNEISNTGNKSLKVTNININKYIRQAISIPKNCYYTFSSFIKNTGKIKLSLSYINEENVTIEEYKNVVENDSFERSDVTIYYPNEAKSDLFITFYFEEIGTTYIDDIQLEEGEIANKYNMIENSDFSKGLDGWILEALDKDISVSTSEIYSIITLNNGGKALKISMNPKFSLTAKKDFDIKGKGGDTYNISFWYKNEGLHSLYPMTDNYVVINYDEGEEWGRCEVASAKLNINENEWQYFTTSFTAERDFDGLQLKFCQYGNANNLYITNIYMIKDYRNINYDYDSDGNVILTKNLDDEITNFNYDKNNQLIQMMNPKGKKFKFEYDNNITDRVINGISESGISNQIKYDQFGNPILTKLINNIKEIVSGKYKIRLKGTNKYLRLEKDKIIITDSYCNHNDWIIEKVNDTYYIHHNILENLYFGINNNDLILTDNRILFKFVENKNGSYLIKQSNTDKYLKVNNNIIQFSNLIENDSSFEFYIEHSSNQEFILNNATYTDDGRFIKSTTDSMFNKTLYDIDEITGLTKSVTNPKNIKTEYFYNDKEQITKIKQKDKEINYEYNNNNLLDKIILNNKTYGFIYDQFLNTKTIKINDNILVNNIFEENNGNLIKSIYGNNDEVNYTYDEFNRIKDIIKENDMYSYKYGNNGELSKIISNNDIYKYNYDLSKRLREYIFNNFKIKYDYDKNGNVANKIYYLNNIEHVINNTYNDDDLITKVIMDNMEINYTYDSLGRLISNNINNYTYKNKGKRTSLIIESIENRLGKYFYKYDELNNITHIYINNNLINKYYYDDYNELIKEDNYITNQTINYEYDEDGNILSKKTYNINTNNLLNENIYEYNNNNWKDQLTKYNNIEIIYDEIGNPIQIGNDILTWINGRQLNSYNDILYKYNKDSIRTSKIVNNIETKYYLENNKIILEQTDNNMLYYLYNDVDELIGFKYNEAVYYYIKNIQDDIIGIIDSNNDTVVKYKYDSFGNIISIKDINNNEVTDINHIGNINPFRYRSYYYDKETKLYYLNSRYYNPLWGRFINIDSLLFQSGNALANNLYLYSYNNPINLLDSAGNLPILSSIKNLAKTMSTTVSTIVGSLNTIANNITNSLKKSLPDYSDVLNKVLIKNAAQALTVKNNSSAPRTMEFFYSMVKNKGDWDYKREKIWNDEFDVPYLGLNGLFVWNDKIINAEQFGNIHYGIIGSVLGYDEKLLYMGGGYAAKGISLKIFKEPYYGDSVEDHNSIKMGIDMYKGR
ncbi:MAG: DNRLRE domain-containing protein [Bacilli bacterium]|nr:DNRLRE domain-containing protein [Bacilli bacterium]